METPLPTTPNIPVQPESIQITQDEYRVFYVSLPTSLDPEKILARSPKGWFQNTGNLLFTTAIQEQIAATKSHNAFSFDPELVNRNYDVTVIPAANWLNERTTHFDKLADQVEGLTIPVVLVGLGAQSVSGKEIPTIPPGVLRLVRAVAQRSHSIGVRGLYTKKVLAAYGVDNAVVTGCPSLYGQQAPFQPALKGRIPQRILVGGTGHSSTVLPQEISAKRPGTCQRSLYRLAYTNDLEFIYQSERPEIDYLIKRSDEVVDQPDRQTILDYYGANTMEEWTRYLDVKGRAYFETHSWREGVSGADFYIGSRLHGTIMALLSGIPACLVTHDARTEELAEFAGIPSIPIGDVQPLTMRKVQDLYASLDLSAWTEKQVSNLSNYIEFLEQNGLRHRLAMRS